MANNLKDNGRRTSNTYGGTILSLLVVAVVVQWRVFGDGVRPVHLPHKKGEGTALPPGEPDQAFSGRFPWCSRVRP